MPPGIYPRPSLRERFDAKYVNADSGCWLWMGTISTEGYGLIHADGRLTLAHRLSYEFHVGPIPEGLALHHVCVVSHCVNPEHLQPVTRAEHENAHRKLICKRGHRRRQKPCGTWYCPECARQWTRRWRDDRRQSDVPEIVYYGNPGGMAA
jgi:hypothetical protein